MHARSKWLFHLSFGHLAIAGLFTIGLFFASQILIRSVQATDALDHTMEVSNEANLFEPELLK